MRKKAARRAAVHAIPVQGASRLSGRARMRPRAMLAVNEALALCDFKRLAVITPYVEDLTVAVASGASVPGRAVAAAHGMGIEDNVELATPTPEDIVAFAAERLKGVEMGGLFCSCTNFRSLEALPELEVLFGVPVVTSNSAVIKAVWRRFEEEAGA